MFNVVHLIYFCLPKSRSQEENTNYNSELDEKDYFCHLVQSIIYKLKLDKYVKTNFTNEDRVKITKSTNKNINKIDLKFKEEDYDKLKFNKSFYDESILSDNGILLKFN